MPYDDLRAYIDELSRRELLHVIEEPVNKDTELVPLVRLLVELVARLLDAPPQASLAAPPAAPAPVSPPAIAGHLRA